MGHQIFMSKFTKEIYGAGILFFYYTKYIILFGWPLLRFKMDYHDNIIIDVLWGLCLALFLNDIVYKWMMNKIDREHRSSYSSKK